MAAGTECVAVLPAYDEEGCIAAVVDGWLAELRRCCGERFRIVVVDDGSRDRTGKILDELAGREACLVVIHQENGGHGAALMRGYHAALALGPSHVFQVDSDDQLRPEDFERLWAHRAESPFVLGTRETRQDPPLRLAVTRSLRLAIRVLFGRDIPDPNVPYRLMRADYLRALLGIVPDGVFAPNVFLSIAAARAGPPLLSVPVHHRARVTGRTSIVRWSLVRACVVSATQLLRFRLMPPGRVPPPVAAPDQRWEPPSRA